MRSFRSFAIIIITVMTIPVQRARAQERVDALFVNARIHTLDSAGTIGDAMAVRDGSVVAVGSGTELRARFAAKAVHDMGHRNLFPGFTDAHGHLHGLGEEEMILTLHDTKSMDAVLQKVRSRAAASPEGAWIRGRGWDENTWRLPALPSRAALDSVSGGHPVLLSRVDGHAVWLNSRALALAGITRETADPPGGRILRDSDGEPSGILVDNAADIAKAAIPPPTPKEMRGTYSAAVRRCLAVGLTGMHDMGLSAENIEALTSLIEQGAFPFRLTGYIDGPGRAWDRLLRDGRSVIGDERLVLAGLKLYADGSLGSRGALLLEPYTDAPHNTGLQLNTIDSIRARAVDAMRRGLQVCVHAIGDAGNRMALDGYEAAMLETGRPRFPLRVEHVQVLSPADVPRFASLGVIPSMQPTHCTSDMRWAEARLGPDRVGGAYAWRSLLNTGVIIPGGSDTPVERPNPLWGIYAACTRRDHEGIPSTKEDILLRFQGIKEPVPANRYAEGWFGEQRMTRMEAIRAFTIWAARAAGLEKTTGSLETGKHADFVILSADITTVPDAGLLSTEVLETWVGGAKAWPSK